MEIPDAVVAHAMDLLLTAGRVMLECGAETSRIEETMTRMGVAFGYESVDALCTTTGLMLTLRTGGRAWTEVVSIDKRGIDLSKVARVNDVSRLVETHKLDLTNARIVLSEIQTAGPCYQFWLRLLARGLSSGCFATLLGGSWHAFLPSLLAGFLVNVVLENLGRVVPDFLAVFFGAAIGTGWAMLSTRLGFGANFGHVIIGVILPLVPGLALTNAVRDPIAGDLLSGVARGAEALLKAVAIAAGVSTVLLAFRWTVWF